MNLIEQYDQVHNDGLRALEILRKLKAAEVLSTYKSRSNPDFPMQLHSDYPDWVTITDDECEMWERL